MDKRAQVGLGYVLNFSITADGPSFAAAPGISAEVLVPPRSMQVVWDWTHLQPGWPEFSAAEAAREWTAALDAARDGGIVSLIVHPWIVELNKEYDVLAAYLDRARSLSAAFTTFDRIVRQTVS